MKILIANRGEIAVRVMRACRELGFPTVAVYSEADAEALHTRYADEAVLLGPAHAAESYLHIGKILQAAKETRADAIHPGYGFLSENPDFAQAIEDAGLIFIGPRPETIALAGNKLAARRIARQAGLPVLPGPDAPVTEELSVDMLTDITFPVLIKAAAGGGGRGIRLARTSEELTLMIKAASDEASAAFGDGTVYLEPLVQQARHVEVQMLGDGLGRVLCVGDRECSIQRRRQKLIEELPAPILSPVLRKNLYDATIHLGQALGYRSLGTVEFLLDEFGGFYFIEINPRIQVEHTVTEMVTGIDLVSMQLRLAETNTFKYTQNDIQVRGAAIEARILAEETGNDNMPATGEITFYKEPGGPGVRTDSAIYAGISVTTDYDSLIAKVIGWGEDRQSAIRRLHRALEETQIGGVATNINLLMQIIDSESFIQGRTNTSYLDTFQPPIPSDENDLEKDLVLAAAMLEHQSQKENKIDLVFENNTYWRFQSWREQMRKQ